MKIKQYCFSGPDGVGKTTLLKRVKELLLSKGIPVEHVWIRYNHYVSKPLLAYLRLLGYTKVVTEKDHIVHKYYELHQTKYLKELFVVCKLIDAIIATLGKITFRQLINPNLLILTDRWVYDIFVDIGVATGIKNLENRKLSKLLLKLSKNSKTVILLADKNELLKRRTENNFDPYLEKRLKLYFHLANKFNLQIVSAINPQTTFNEAIKNLLPEEVDRYEN
jgi:thymidylate kinase